ncbi:MAG TPA: hypothetical protein VMH39_03335, partial [Gemmatimonadaceae bacterium]|nr:hypothetical protein [Gemmatimonadaceae bacterium]
EAAVNEVTIFRIFGSKASLFDALMQLQAGRAPTPLLPEHVEDPEHDVAIWAEAVLHHMRENRSLIRTSIGEMEDRPGAAVCMCERPNTAATLLADYVARLQSTGRADPAADVPTAVAMLMSSLFADAVCRDIMPKLFPRPDDDAPARYVRIFLRSLGVRMDGAVSASLRSAG